MENMPASQDKVCLIIAAYGALALRVFLWPCIDQNNTRNEAFSIGKVHKVLEDHD
jgi:hypothetical protein